MCVATPVDVLDAVMSTPPMPASYALPVMSTVRNAFSWLMIGFCASSRPPMSNAPAARFLMTGPSPARPVFVKRMPTPSGDACPSSSLGPFTTAVRWVHTVPPGATYLARMGVTYLPAVAGTFAAQVRSGFTVVAMPFTVSVPPTATLSGITPLTGTVAVDTIVPSGGLKIMPVMSQPASSMSAASTTMRRRITSPCVARPRCGAGLCHAVFGVDQSVTRAPYACVYGPTRNVTELRRRRARTARSGVTRRHARPIELGFLPAVPAPRSHDDRRDRGWWGWQGDAHRRVLRRGHDDDGCRSRPARRPRRTRRRGAFGLVLHGRARLSRQDQRDDRARRAPARPQHRGVRRRGFGAFGARCVARRARERWSEPGRQRRTPVTACRVVPTKRRAATARLPCSWGTMPTGRCSPSS